MNKQANINKHIIRWLPYVLIFWFFTKVGLSWRMAGGSDVIQRGMAALLELGRAFDNPLPSFFPSDLLVGLCGAAGFRLMVYTRGKNAKKYRKDVEYGSARWGSPEDIKPYVDPVVENNIILTATEALTMNSRPKNSAFARNKNVLVVGGSGSGKTRFFVKPNIV